jgi:predicted permease
MLVIGIVITRSDLRKILTDQRAYAISLGRLIVMPASLLLLILASGILTRHPELKPVFQVCFIALCTPPGATVSQLAVLYDKKAYESSVYSVLSMALCIVTMPLMLMVFQFVFGT